MKNFEDTENKYGKLVQVLFVAILAVGLILRTYQHFMGRSLWGDECHFALNFIKYGFWDLTKPLDHIQAGPILFLWGVKAIAEVFGYTEVVLRSLTWFSCILTLPLFYFVSLHFTQKKIAALLAFFLFSVNVSLIYFSSELKPYGIDVSAYLLIVYLTLSNNSFVSKYRHTFLAVGGVLSILLSNTAFIIVFCSAVYLIYNWYIQKKVIAKDIMVMALWGVVFIANYLIFIHDHPSTVYQRINYSFTFVPRDIFSQEFISYFDERLNEIFFSMLLYIWKAYYISYFIVIAFVISTVRMVVKRQFALFLFTWVPILITLTLSFMHIYPFWYRLILFLVPAFLILLSYGTYLIAEFLARKMHFLAGAALFFVCTFFYTKENFANFPLWPLEVKPALDWVNDNVTDDMHLYMSTPDNAYKYYLFRNYVSHPVYKSAVFNLNAQEYYGMVLEETTPYVFFYGSSYVVFPYRGAVEDFKRRGLVVKEFEYGGYIVSIINPLPPVGKLFTTIDASSFDSTAQGQVPIWGGHITSKPVTLPKGDYKMVVISSGSPMEGVHPLNSLYINDTKIGEFSSYSERSRSEPISYQQQEDGTVQFKINLDNDANNGQEDRNSFIWQIFIYSTDDIKNDVVGNEES